MPDFDSLYFHVKILEGLLRPADREVGLSSWSVAVAEHWRAIAEMYKGMGQ